MGGYLVSLTAIAAIKQIYEAFSWSNIGKPQKNPFFRRLMAQNLLFLQMKWSFLSYADLLQSNGWLPCKFELNRSNTANLLSVFLE